MTEALACSWDSLSAMTLLEKVEQCVNCRRTGLSRELRLDLQLSPLAAWHTCGLFDTTIADVE